ncbi:MAG: hypothetical protein ACE5JJ_08675, partial [Nitrospinota bacterium]
ALSEEEFRERYGIRKRETERVRLCLAGDGSAHLIEAKYLEPEVHSLMEVQSVEIDPADLKHKVLLVSERKSALRRKHVLDYIRWGEEQGFDRRPTCAGRAKNRPWYDLAPNRKSDILWPMTQKYRHVVPLNNRQYVCNHRLFDVYAGEGVDAEVLCAVLNSTIVAFTKNFYGRWAGTEGTLDTEVVDVERLPVPDPRTFSPECIAKIQAAFRAFWKKPTLHLRQELSIPERKELDSAVLNALGFGESEIGPFLDNFYACVDRLYAEYRAIERQANANRARAARRGRSTPQSIAAEIWEALLADELPPRPFPQAFLPSSPKTEIIKIPDGPAHYDEDLFDGQVVQVGTTRIKLGDRDRAHLLLAMIREGYSGAVSLPTNGLLCRNALREWLPYREELAERFEELAASRTGDERTQERIVRDLWRRYRRLSQEG